MVGDAAGAWRTALDVEKLCRESADDELEEVAWRQLDLAEVLSLCGRNDVRGAARAEGPARAALSAYRCLVDQDPGNFQPELRSAVTTLATVLERLGRHAEAVDATHLVRSRP
jgi:hypothetical protein